MGKSTKLVLIFQCSILFRLLSLSTDVFRLLSLSTDVFRLLSLSTDVECVCVFCHLCDELLIVMKIILCYLNISEMVHRSSGINVYELTLTSITMQHQYPILMWRAKHTELIYCRAECIFADVPGHVGLRDRKSLRSRTGQVFFSEIDKFIWRPPPPSTRWGMI